MMKKYFLMLLLLQYPLFAVTADTSNTIEDISKKYLGEPYVWGGNTPETGMDCSGYTKYVFKKVGINIPRTALSQSKEGQTVARNNLKKGDLLFFLTDKKRGIPITHVGIYLDNGKFIHAASSKKGIIISSLNGKYGKKFVTAKRVISPKNNASREVLYFTLEEEAMHSSMRVKITSFGGIHDTF